MGLMGILDPVLKMDRRELKIVPDEVFITPQLRKDIWRKRFDIMVKTAKEAISSNWAAPILLAILIGYNVYSDRTQTSKIDIMSRDIIVLQTQKEDAEKYNNKELQRMDAEKFQIDRENIARTNALQTKLDKLELTIKEKQ